MAESKRVAHSRNLLMIRYREFCRARCLVMNQETMLMFVVTTRTNARSKLTYITSLMARLQPPTLLSRVRRALRRQAAVEPLVQARPASWQLIEQCMNNLPPREKIALYLGWRTASRMDEIVHLNRSHIQLISLTSIIIYWGATTKTSQEDPFLPWLYVEVGPPIAPGRRSYMGDAVRVLNQLSSNEVLVQHHALIEAQLERHGLTGHSIKRGAVTELLQRAAEGKFQPQLVPLVAKHATEAILPRSTLRYAANPTSVARILHTVDATAWL